MARQKKQSTKKSTKKTHAGVPHQHILTPVRGSAGQSLRCTLRGCRYGEWWDGERYRAYDPALGSATVSRPAVQAELEAQRQNAIRPHTLWGEEGSANDDR